MRFSSRTVKLASEPSQPFRNHEQCARALIEAKADLEKVNKDSFTALMISAQNGHEPVRAFRLERLPLLHNPHNRFKITISAPGH